MSDSLSRRQFLHRTTAAAAAAGMAAATDPCAAEAGQPASAPSPAAVGAPARESAAGEQPNILFIMTDQQRWDCLGAHGNRIIRTPHLDKLAARSANFTRAVVQSPVCVPSRASMFNGRYAHAHRNRVNYTPLKADEVPLPQRLQQAGYQTALVGKLHLYYAYPPTSDEARRIGFDLVQMHDGVSYTDQWSDYAAWRNERDPLRQIHYRRTAASVPKLREKLPPGTNPFRAAIDEQYTDTAWTGLKTREYIRQMAADRRPWFLFSSFWKPHSPFEIAAPYDAIYNDVQFKLPRAMSLDDMHRLPLSVQKLALRGNRPPYDMDRDQLQWMYRSYYGAITQIDHEVGQILQSLDQAGQRDNTVIVFISDHGDQLLEHGIMGKNVFFEASVRVPMMIHMADRIRPGTYDDLVETIDVFPTLCQLAGTPVPDNCHGQSLLPRIGQSDKDRAAAAAYKPRDAVFSENIIPEVITSGGLDFSFEKGAGVKGIRHPDAKMVRTDRWKYNYYPEGDAELYDLANDPGEYENLAADPARKGTVDELKGRILDWLITATEVDQIAPRWVIS